MYAPVGETAAELTKADVSSCETADKKCTEYEKHMANT